MNYEERQLNRQTQKEREELDKSKRSERSERVVNFLEKIKAYDFLSNRLREREEREDITFDQFQSFLIRLHGIIREIPKKDRKFDGKNVELTGGIIGETVLFPRQEDKEELLEYAFNSAKELKDSDNAYMLPAVINSLHMFSDGNGRVSRVIYLLLHSENKESFALELKKALDIDGRFDTEDINPNHVNWEVEKYVLADHGWIIDPETKKVNSHPKLRGGIASALYRNINYDSIAGKNIKKFRKISESNDIYYILTSIIERLSDDKYNSILLRDESRPNINGKLISPVSMQELSEEDWKNIFEKYYELKKEHIYKLVDVFKNPQSYVNDFDESETLKDMFIRKIREEYEENNKA